MRRLLVGCGVAGFVGCQVVAPLPDVDTGEAGGARSVSAVSTSAAATTGDAMSECGDPACAAQCDALDSRCSATPQYPNVSVCCDACVTLGHDASKCRPAPPPQPDAVACSNAGAIGKTGPPPGCISGCAAVCSLFVAACSAYEESDAQKCTDECAATPFDGTFDMCSTSPFSCRLRETLLAMVAGADKKDLCHNAAKAVCKDDACD